MYVIPILYVYESTSVRQLINPLPIFFTDKKLSSYSINLSSSSSNASSCSRSSGGVVHAKVPQSSPKTVSSDELNKNATQSGDVAVPRDDQKPTQPPPPPPRKPTSLDMKLAILRKEMVNTNTLINNVPNFRRYVQLSVNRMNGNDTRRYKIAKYPLFVKLEFFLI